MYLPHLSWLVLTPVYFYRLQPGQPPIPGRDEGPQAQLAEPPSPSLGICLCQVLQTAEGQSKEEGN